MTCVGISFIVRAARPHDGQSPQRHHSQPMSTRGSGGTRQSDCCAELAIRDHLRRRDWIVRRDVTGRGVLELRSEWAGREVSVQWLAPRARPNLHGCCGASFVRVDVGRPTRAPDRWALWTRSRSDSAEEPLVIQVAGGQQWLSAVTSFPCEAGGARSFSPVRGLFDALEIIAEPTTRAMTTGTVIGQDPVWALDDWNAPMPTPGRDQLWLGIGNLGAAALAVPLGAAVQLTEAGIAWALASVFTGLGFLGFSKIQQHIAKPTSESVRLAAILASPDTSVWGPRTASTIRLPVVTQRANRRRVDHAAVDSALMSTTHPTGERIRLVSRAVVWPRGTHGRCRLVPRRWLGIEVLGWDGTDLPDWLTKEVEEGTVRSVVAPREARFDEAVQALAMRPTKERR